MAQLPGMTPVQQGGPTVRHKQQRTVSPYTSHGQVALTPTAQAVDTYVPPQKIREDRRLSQFAEALSQFSPALERYATQRDDRLGKEQIKNDHYYAEIIRRDREAGVITAVQAKEIFPELVPTAAAHIAEKVAKLDAKDFIQDRIQGILEDDSIRLNTENRNAYMEEIRKEALEFVGDNPFYGSAYMGQVQRSLNEFETTWMRETAGYHEALMGHAFMDEVSDALRTGEDLLAIDAQWKERGPLNNLQRNERVIQAAVNLALETGDESYLERVPDRFLNAEAKANFARTQKQLRDAQWSDLIRSKQVDDWRHQEEQHARQVDVLRRMMEGEQVTAREFANDPATAAFVNQWNMQPLVHPVASKAARKNLESYAIWTAMTNPGGVNRESLTNHILSTPDLAPQDKVTLLEGMDGLLEGLNFMDDPSIKRAEDNIKAHLSAVRNNLGPVLEGTLHGSSLDADALRFWESSLHEALSTYYWEHGEMPGPMLKRQMVREIEAETSQYIRESARLISEGREPHFPHQQGARAAPPQSSSAPSASSTVPEGMKRELRYNPDTGVSEVVFVPID